MNIPYQCNGRKGMKPKAWPGEIASIRSTTNKVHELNVNARGSYFHIIVGQHKYGNYLCVPNWGIGTEVAELTNREWNLRQLTSNYPKISKVDLISIADALVAYGRQINSHRYDLAEEEYPF